MQLCFFVILNPGCAPGSRQELVLPASFSGTIPCADCAGVRLTINFWADSTYYLREEYLGEDDVVFDIGKWKADGDLLTLVGAHNGPMSFHLESPASLHMLDLEGDPIDSDQNYDLTRLSALEDFEPHLSLRGMYSYMADAGQFRECLSGRRFFVAQEGDNAALERAYTAKRKVPAEPLLVVFDGMITNRPKMDGPGKEDVVVVKKFIAISSGECDTAFPKDSSGFPAR